jgi:hypothetical protein
MTERHLTRIVLAVAASLAVYGAVRWWHGERVFARMRTTTCTVLSKKVESKLLVSSRRRSTARAWYRDEAHLVFAHTVDGRRFTFAEDFTQDWGWYAHAGYEEGSAHPCRYDPQDPGHGTVRRGFESSDARQTIVLGGLLAILAAFIPRGWRDTARWYEKHRR